MKLNTKLVYTYEKHDEGKGEHEMEAIGYWVRADYKHQKLQFIKQEVLKSHDRQENEKMKLKINEKGSNRKA